jgi:uncharacterized membrane protein YfcA
MDILNESPLIYHALIAIAAFMDSIAGGGGLITVPVFSLILGPGTEAIATNKIVAGIVTLTALIVYQRKGHMLWRESRWFVIGILLGTVCGAQAGTWLSTAWLKYALTFTAPIILFFTLKRDSFVQRNDQRSTDLRLFLIALPIGFYDGIYGPGGGTFMFLALNWFGGMTLMQAIAISKLANFVSASGSLISYASADQVHWKIGFQFIPVAIAGALIGSALATKKAKEIVRPILVLVVILLLCRIWWNEIISLLAV